MEQLAPDRDPCLQIQVDLSAMLDGELDASSVRRVLVHAAACPHCRGFLKGIQRQVHAHRDLYEVLDEANRTGPEPLAVAKLRQQLTENRERLARIFYELGRGFVLMGTSPHFSRTVQREPVPIPDMVRRGELLLEELGDLAADADVDREQWVRARALLSDGRVCAPQHNLERGKSLLEESLFLDARPYEPRVYLGHAHHVSGQRELARRQFETVIEGEDPIGRVFGWMHLGNLQIDERDWAGAAQSFESIVSSGVISDHIQFGLVYFNLALCCGHLQRFEECESWLTRLHEEMPHKRLAIARELRTREQFLGLLRRQPKLLDRFVDRFPGWFESIQRADLS
jgi:tetratricopeptide (TPR) repeat protein